MRPGPRRPGAAPSRPGAAPSRPGAVFAAMPAAVLLLVVAAALTACGTQPADPHTPAATTASADIAPSAASGSGASGSGASGSGAAGSGASGSGAAGSAASGSATSGSGTSGAAGSGESGSGESGSPASGGAKRVSDGWEITVYYTAVEKFHHGAAATVTGCPKLDCTNGTADLGSYPADFVRAVHDEGTGQTTSGQYLNWSYDIGYWLDSEPRSSDGTRLTPFVSSAADPNVLPHGTRFAIAACGRQDDGSAPPAATCAALRASSWRITDEFTPGLGGNRHIDAYVGPETGPGFTDSDWYITLDGVRLNIG